MIKIDKNIPIPPNNSQGGRPSKYPWRDMAVGDSFRVEGKTCNAVTGMASSAGKRLGMKFTVRTEDGGHRIWRTE